MAKLRKRRRARRSSLKPNPAYRSNPSIGLDVLQDVLPGFGAFVVTRFGARMATVAIARTRPSLARHAGAVASLATFAAAWFGAHRVKSLAKYHDALVVGSAIAAMQTLVQTYLPFLAWTVTEVQPAAIAHLAPAAQLAPQAGFGDTAMPVDQRWYAHGDEYDAGRWNATPAGPGVAAQPVQPRAQPAQAAAAAVDDLLSDLEPDAMKSWSFGGAGFD